MTEVDLSKSRCDMRIAIETHRVFSNEIAPLSNTIKFEWAPFEHVARRTVQPCFMHWRVVRRQVGASYSLLTLASAFVGKVLGAIAHPLRAFVCQVLC